MISKTVSIILLTVVTVLSLFLIEGACFRLVEPYANWRLTFAWGEPDMPKQNAILSKLPFDHFLQPPAFSSEWRGHVSSLEEEFEYAKKISSFNRPTRDRYYNFVLRQINPLRNYEIIDLGMIEEVVVPGMRRAASQLDVDIGLARRTGLPLNYSKALFIYVIPPGNRTVYETEFARMENAFSFLLGHGIACVLLNPETPEELGAKVRFLKAQHPNFAEKVFAYAEGGAVELIDQMPKDASEQLSCVIVKDPTQEIMSNHASTWFLGLITDGSMDKKIQKSIIQRVRNSRDNPNLYKSRLAGLLFKNSKLENLSLSSNAVAYILNCLKFFDATQHANPNPFQEGEANESLMVNLLHDGNESVNELSIVNMDESDISESEPTFECDVIREYRQLNPDDPSMANLSNRELVLSLGSSFEEMGEEILLEVAERDPLFYRFYLSLKEIHHSQN